jgi:hypothetical protein
MIIDEPAPSFFSNRRVLEQIDHLNEAVDAFADDLADRRLNWLEAELSRLAHRYPLSWEYKSSRRDDPRYIAIGWKGEKNKWPPSLRIEFGWSASLKRGGPGEYGKMPRRPWIGVNVNAQTRARNQIYQTAKHLFTSLSEREEGYPIFEYVKNWPDLDECHWVDLYPLIEGNGIDFMQPLVDQIAQIAGVLT